ncbi:PIN domain-containing protein [Parasediminibacterium sp. JCM 36343]|uniref:PIN domain-containing protein n=1 Tax=Parasediminibacterium sp. JCM 36343 TaxID=3374279 RepID=UPI0039784B0D
MENGISTRHKNKAEVEKIIRQIHNFASVELSSSIGEVAFRLITQYSKSHSLKIPDAIIAASCLLMDIPLFTFNHEDYKFIKGLQLYIP